MGGQHKSHCRTCLSRRRKMSCVAVQVAPYDRAMALHRLARKHLESLQFGHAVLKHYSRTMWPSCVRPLATNTPRWLERCDAQGTMFRAISECLPKGPAFRCRLRGPPRITLDRHTRNPAQCMGVSGTSRAPRMPINIDANRAVFALPAPIPVPLSADGEAP